MTAAKPRCLDIHAHHVGQPLIACIDAGGARHGVRMVKGGDGATRIEVGGRLTGMPLIPPLSDEAARLKWMDEAGIDVQLLAGWMDLAGYHLPAEGGQWLARAQNETLAEMVARRPDRYAAAAMVPLQDAALENVHRLGPAAALTGPAVRGDAGTIDRNLRSIAGAAPHLVAPYVAMCRASMELAGERLSSEGRASIEGVLAAWS